MPLDEQIQDHIRQMHADGSWEQLVRLATLRQRRGDNGLACALGLTNALPAVGGSLDGQYVPLPEGETKIENTVNGRIDTYVTDRSIGRIVDLDGEYYSALEFDFLRWNGMRRGEAHELFTARIMGVGGAPEPRRYEVDRTAERA